MCVGVFICMLVADCLRSISLLLERIKIKQRHQISSDITSLLIIGHFFLLPYKQK